MKSDERQKFYAWKDAQPARCHRWTQSDWRDAKRKLKEEAKDKANHELRRKYGMEIYGTCFQHLNLRRTLGEVGWSKEFRTHMENIILGIYIKKKIRNAHRNIKKNTIVDVQPDETSYIPIDDNFFA